MENDNTYSTLIAVLTGAAIPLVGWIVFHFFASRRDKRARSAAAAADFRNALLQSTKGVPDSGKHWTNDLLIRLRNTEPEIDTACQIYSYFLGPCKKKRFLGAASDLKALILDDLPKPKTQEELALSGGLSISEEKKKRFHELKEKLLSYAKST